MFTNNTELLSLLPHLITARSALGQAVALSIEANESEVGARLLEAIGHIEAVCQEMARPGPATYTPHEHRLLFENDAGACPVCGRERGFSVPEDCADNVACPEPEDIERQLLS